MEKDWVVVYETSLEYQAEIAREVLENNGIKAVVLNQKDSSYMTFGPIEVYVHQSNKEKSIELLKDLKA
ncbi:putative signal transducing protein [Sunxiuqinia sp. A32]|uniref:putative signal transducing protein n=1 Tax=Sunxiuqinia sp. A32 TaxID=3461496 RepID=UPI00404686BE